MAADDDIDLEHQRSPIVSVRHQWIADCNRQIVIAQQNIRSLIRTIINHHSSAIIRNELSCFDWIWFEIETAQ